MALKLDVGVDPVYYAHYKFRRREFDTCIECCNDLLAVNPYDQVGRRPLICNL